MEEKGTSIEQEREKMYSMAVTLEMEEMAVSYTHLTLPTKREV